MLLVNIHALFLCETKTVLQLPWRYNTNLHAVANAFQKKNRKPNKVRVDKCIKFYNRSMKSWLKDNDTEFYSAHTEAKHFARYSLLVTFSSLPVTFYLLLVTF